MTTINIVSGFLGAGKTTLIKKLIDEVFKGEKLVLIENEFGEIGIDGGFLKDAGIEITEMNSGCICCSLVGDFGTALKEVLERFAPDRILIEPSGVGKLSDVTKAVTDIDDANIELAKSIVVADVTKCKMYMKNFGEFFNNQVEHASAILLSRTQKMSQEKLEAAVSLLREHNEKARIITTPWDELTGAQILSAMEKDVNVWAGVHLLAIYKYVHVQFFQHFLQLVITEPPDQQFLGLRLHFNESLRGQFLGQKTVHQRNLLVLQTEFGGVGGGHVPGAVHLDQGHDAYKFLRALRTGEGQLEGHHVVAVGGGIGHLDLGQIGGQGSTHGIHVVGEDGEHIACLMGIEERNGQPGQVVEQILAHLAYHIPAEPDHDGGKCPADQG